MEAVGNLSGVVRECREIRSGNMGEVGGREEPGFLLQTERRGEPPGKPRLPSIRALTARRGSEARRPATPSTSSGSIRSAASADRSGRSVSLHNSFWYAPFVTAQAWAVLDSVTGTLLYGSLETQSREIASLTKIATCLLCLRLAQEDESAMKSTVLSVSRLASAMPGTSARLREGDEIYIWDALFAMMLPSGNDAAYSLAEFFGRRLRDQSQSDSPRSPVAFFVRGMNELVRSLGLTATSFANPHGLPNCKNRSTAKDVSLLAFHAMKSGVFVRIVSTREYSCYVGQRSTSFAFRSMRWTNTNRLLDRGWEGVKTGITAPAGPCLCAKAGKALGGLIVTVLACRTMDKRWEEVEKLAKWTNDRRNSQR